MTQGTPREPIIDAHHHIWRRDDLPWLKGPEVPRIFGPYAPIRRDYPIEEYLADLAGTGVVASVYVQTNWDPGTAVKEVAWVQETADRAGWPHAIVGYADMLDPETPKVFAEQAKYPLMRGVRMQLHWHEKTLYRFQPTPDLCDDPRLRANMAALADHGWSFDLQVFSSQTESAARLAADVPSVTFVLQHCGMPEDRSPEGMAAWREGMKRLAQQPNVVVKLSALGTFVQRLDEALIADVVGDTHAIFGADRCLFGSNFPIEKLWTTYPELIAAYQSVLASYSDTDRRAMLHDTAKRVYRL
jgi:predicted TIM-barrel fold metal-dependent hydrolase